MLDPVSRAAPPSRNLLIVHTPNKQAVSDWLTVKQRIEETAPDIEVRIITNGMPDTAAQRWLKTRPSLVLSFCRLVEFQPEAGKIYAGRTINKIEQIKRLTALGLPAPHTSRLTRNFSPDLGLWGRYVVAKPTGGTMGQGVRLLRTVDVTARYNELTFNETQDVIVQPYIEHSEDGYPTAYRVLTLFGKVIYATRNSWAVARPTLEKIARDPNGIIASNSRQFVRVRQLWCDADIITLGERAHAAFPECPLLGVDILRCVESGKLYVMEVNPAGETWHLSGRTGPSFTPEYKRSLYAQFDALDRVARVLIEKTRAEAA